MSEVMDQGIIGMPFDMAMSDELSRRQFYSRAQAVLSERDALAARVAELERDAARRVPLYEAVQRACGELPDAWTIELHMENGAGWVELYDAEGNEVEDFPSDRERLDYTVIDALEAALAQSAKETQQ